MDWFHCNRCFRQEGASFAVTSCGHVLCATCGAAAPCPVCAADCRYLPISDQANAPAGENLLQEPSRHRPQALDPHLPGEEEEDEEDEEGRPAPRQPHASSPQVWRFQRAQTDMLLASHKEKTRRARAALEETRHVLESRNRELEALRRENGELRRAQLSPGWRGGSRSSTPRPVGVTSPAQTVTPQPRRQLSSQVVSRSAPLEPPLSHGTPVWQVGSARRGWVTPQPSSVAPSPASAHGLTHRAAPPAPRSPLWVPWASPPLPAAIFPAETPSPYPSLRPPPRG
ncbi:RING finger protein 212B isoform X2 [Grus americana]|uniref:RING finger protein 212B isoform X2 n=1 Tax=Grus americana TaxID=9117 RepID=UPI00240875CC|nr:RING finger protein 212B isoform X2 [Grus americana]